MTDGAAGPEPRTTPDGRLLSVEDEARLDAQMTMVGDWLQAQADAALRESVKLGARGRYGEAALYARDHAILERTAVQARRGNFLPPDQQPCIDGAGNRGGHMGYVGFRSVVGKNVRFVCGFCGRP